MGAARKAVESLLLQPNRETKGVGYADASGAVVYSAVQRLHIGDQDAIRYVVIGVETLALRPHSRRGEAPALIGAILDRAAGTQSLRDSKRGALHAPGANVFRNHRGSDRASEFAPDPAMDTVGEVLTNGRAKERVARGVASNQRGLTPRPAYREIQSP